MRIERILADVTTLGYGKRIGIWVNGCNRNCKGCVSKRLQKIDPLTECDIEQSLKDYNFIRHDGVTISGGEPFDQPKELMHLVQYIRNRNVKDILIYTGYLREELIDMHLEEIDYVLNNIDVLIDGPYVEELNDNTSNIKGSSNQRVFFINEELRNKYEAYYKEQRNMEEYHIDNLLIGIGIPTKEYVKKFTKK